MAKNNRETRSLHLRNGLTYGRTNGPMDGRTDGRTDRPSYRDAFLTDASKKQRCIRVTGMEQEKVHDGNFVNEQNSEGRVKP